MLYTIHVNSNKTVTEIYYPYTEAKTQATITSINKNKKIFSTFIQQHTSSLKRKFNGHSVNTE